jgi:hypothetical protein
MVAPKDRSIADHRRWHRPKHSRQSQLHRKVPRTNYKHKIKFHTFFRATPSKQINYPKSIVASVVDNAGERTLARESCVSDGGDVGCATPFESIATSEPTVVGDGCKG